MKSELFEKLINTIKGGSSPYSELASRRVQAQGAMERLLTFAMARGLQDDLARELFSIIDYIVTLESRLAEKDPEFAKAFDGHLDRLENFRRVRQLASSVPGGQLEYISGDIKIEDGEATGWNAVGLRGADLPLIEELKKIGFLQHTKIGVCGREDEGLVVNWEFVKDPLFMEKAFKELSAPAYKLFGKLVQTAKDSQRDFMIRAAAAQGISVEEFMRTYGKVRQKPTTEGDPAQKAAQGSPGKEGEKVQGGPASSVGGSDPTEPVREPGNKEGVKIH